MDSHYVVERGVAFEAHTQLKINDGVTLYKLFIKKFRAQMLSASVILATHVTDNYVYNYHALFFLYVNQT